MEATKFKKGDKVTLTKPEPGDWGGWAKEECRTGVFTIGHVSNSGDYFDLEGCLYTHRAAQFEIAPDVLTVIMRRPVDCKTIEKFMHKKGYSYVPDDEIDLPSIKDSSRVLNIHLSGTYKGSLTYNAPVKYATGTKAAIIENNAFMKSYFGHGTIKVIKSKPSVNEAINQIKNLL